MPTLDTTTIGSLYRFREDLLESIDEAIAFQSEFGLDLISDGEQRTDMVSYFAESLSGLSVADGMPVIDGRVELRGDPTEFSKVKDLAYIRSKHPGLEVKVAITGPTTLGMTCGSRGVGLHYESLNDFALYEDIAAALAPIAKSLASLGAHVQIDEPFLSQGYRDLGERVALLDAVADGLPADRTSVHVCGSVGRFGVLSHLMRLENISVISLGFAGRQERSNIEVIEGAGFAENGKVLGAGCIAVTPLSEEEVGDPESVRALLASISDRIGMESIAYAHPDCGLRVTGKSLVPIILRNLRDGVDLLGRD
jgi:methionine synthase II (cobalamin-independent)